jgi:hypothetical protein
MFCPSFCSGGIRSRDGLIKLARLETFAGAACLTRFLAGNSTGQKSVGLVRHERQRLPSRRPVRLISPIRRVAVPLPLPLLIGQKLSAHGDFYPVSFGIFDFFHFHGEIDGAHDAVSEFLVN